MTASKQHHTLLHQSGFIILVRESSFQLLRTQCDDKPRIFSNARGLVSNLFFVTTNAGTAWVIPKNRATRFEANFDDFSEFTSLGIYVKMDDFDFNYLLPKYLYGLQNECLIEMYMRKF